MLPLLFISPSRKETLSGTFIPYRYNRRHPSQPCRKYMIPGSILSRHPALILISQIAQAISCSVRHSGAMFRQFPFRRSQHSRLLCKTKASCHNRQTSALLSPSQCFPFLFYTLAQGIFLVKGKNAGFSPMKNEKPLNSIEI